MLALQVIGLVFGLIFVFIGVSKVRNKSFEDGVRFARELLIDWETKVHGTAVLKSTRPAKTKQLHGKRARSDLARR
jgi:hypothetical protein